MANAPATAVDKMLPLLKTKDNRSKAQGGYHQAGAAPQSTSDDMPDWMQDGF